MLLFKKVFNISKNPIILILFLSFSILFINIFQYLKYIENLNNNINNDLIKYAMTVKSVIGHDYLNKSNEINSISKEEYNNIQKKLEELGKTFKVTNLYSIIYINNKFYYTSSNKNNKNNVHYFDEYKENTENLRKFLNKKEIFFEEKKNQFGNFKTIYMPFNNNLKNISIIGIDLDVNYINILKKDAFKNYILFPMILLFFIFMIGYYYIIKSLNYNNLLIKANEELESLLLKQEKLSLIDPLTGIPNRLKLIEDIKLYNNPYLIIIDIDNFSSLNEFYGNDIGDTVLIEMSSFINSNLDIKHCKCYRYNSDKFAILGYDINLEIFQRNITKLIEMIEFKDFNINNNKINIKLNSAYSFEDKSILLKTIDIVLTQIKRKNIKNLIYTKELGIENEVRKNIEWNQKLKQAVDNDKIVCFYQPILNNNTLKIEKFETLIRLIDENNNVISPFLFLDVAKKSKQYLELTKIVISQSFEKFKDKNFQFSINLTIEDILNKDIQDILKSKALEKKFKDKIVFEIVENENIEKFETITEFIENNKNLGVKIAIDDFGTGYSNFEYLIKMHPDYIKIDGSLIKNILVNKDLEDIVKIIIDFAKIKGLKTIAEFVSSKEIFDKVIELGIDYSQGYYIGEPSRELKEEFKIQ